MSDETNDSMIHLGILSTTDAGHWTGDAVAAVVRAELGVRLGETVLEFRTTQQSSNQRSRSAWKPAAAPSWTTGLDAVVVDASIPTARRPAAGIGPDVTVIETTVFDDTAALCSLFAGTLDSLAVETRHRMLRHLGVIADDTLGDVTDSLDRAREIFGGGLTTTDRYVIAVQHLDPNAALRSAEIDDPERSALAALALGRDADSHAVLADFDALALRLGDISSATTPFGASVLRRRVAELEAEVARLGDELDATRRNSADALDAAAQREHTLTNRLEAASLRAATPR